MNDRATPANSGYPLNIDGLEPLAVVNPNDRRTGAVRFRFRAETKRESIDRLVDELPNGYVISFFDAEIPKWSDPGAYFNVLHSGENLCIQAGNHGWMTKFRKEDPDTLKRLIWACREYNMDDREHFIIQRYVYNIVIGPRFAEAFEKVYADRLRTLPL